ncbi:hypothetical protein IAD21_01283 [Abditibacteriota bacterium]|nr:hypothetical protein IAD21_01283 [Abditibacteriota bacterium]
MEEEEYNELMSRNREWAPGKARAVVVRIEPYPSLPLPAHQFIGPTQNSRLITQN